MMSAEAINIQCASSFGSSSSLIFSHRLHLSGFSPLYASFEFTRVVSVVCGEMSVVCLEVWNLPELSDGGEAIDMQEASALSPTECC